MMVTIGIDPHKQAHAGVAVDPLGVQIAQRTVAARREGFGQLVEWARKLDSERVWVIEDVRHVSGGLERFLIDRGETVVRLPPRLMADARQGVRERGKSDPIDALAIARAALREGVETLPTARLAGPELEIRLLALHRERLVDSRTRLINELRWQLHDLWPEWEIPKRVLIGPAWQTKIALRLRPTATTVQVQIARDMINRVRELTRTITQLYEQLADLVKRVAPQLLAEKGLGVLIAAKLIGEIAGIDRFTSEAQLARISGCAPIPVSSGQTSRHRLDPGGNRQLNHAFHMLALTKILNDPRTAVYLGQRRVVSVSVCRAPRPSNRGRLVANYEFLTTWCTDAPIDAVFDLLKDSAGYPRWWKGVRSVDRLEDGDDEGVGALDRFTWRSVLPYSLGFDLRVTHVERPHLISGDASGELEGVGTWRLYEGNGVAIVYDWRVRTTKRWMNAVGPLARPAFTWNHDLVMRQGGQGLAAELGATLLLHD